MRGVQRDLSFARQHAGQPGRQAGVSVASRECGRCGKHGRCMAEAQTVEPELIPSLLESRAFKVSEAVTCRVSAVGLCWGV